MPACNIKNCTRPTTTFVLVYDPFNHIYESAYLCQIDSDQILQHYIESYETMSAQIQHLNGEMEHLKTANLDSLAKIEKTKEYSTKVRTILIAKNKLSNHTCRNRLCNTEIKKREKRYTVTAIHDFGFRHYLYFDKLDCLNQFKAKVGMYVPILENQLSLTKYV